eukprot:1159097-Pelagomonas_calceolata.AAC.10
MQACPMTASFLRCGWLQVKSYDQYVRLREHTLGATVGDPSFGIEEGADIELPPVEELQTAHSEDTVFIDMYGQELQQVSDWMMDGYRVVARGQVALVLIAGGCCRNAASKVSIV